MPQRTAPTLAAFNPFLMWFEFATKNMEMLLASGVVIGTRVNRMAMAGPNPSARDRKEFTLMGAEKVKAMQDSALAVGLRMQQAQLQMATAALTPFHAASTANARRLTRTRRSTRAARR
jgi:hypothetical protein